jgi:hypothetical protein
VKWSKQTQQIVSELLSIADLCRECPKVGQVIAARVQKLLAGDPPRPWEISFQAVQELLAEMKRPSL